MSIAGYRKLTPEEVQAVNGVKVLGEFIAGAFDSLPVAAPDADPRWVSIARTHFQEGCMALTRAITKPETFA